LLETAAHLCRGGSSVLTSLYDSVNRGLRAAKVAHTLIITRAAVALVSVIALQTLSKGSTAAAQSCTPTVGHKHVSDTLSAQAEMHGRHRLDVHKLSAFTKNWAQTTPKTAPELSQVSAYTAEITVKAVNVKRSMSVQFGKDHPRSTIPFHPFPDPQPFVARFRWIQEKLAWNSEACRARPTCGWFSLPASTQSKPSV
jgi:hypothetical protein